MITDESFSEIAEQAVLKAGAFGEEDPSAPSVAQIFLAARTGMLCRVFMLTTSMHRTWVTLSHLYFVPSKHINTSKSICFTFFFYQNQGGWPNIHPCDPRVTWTRLQCRTGPWLQKQLDPGSVRLDPMGKRSAHSDLRFKGTVWTKRRCGPPFFSRHLY